ncbi:hypothetical protein CR194_13320 [Salipaludibacillus keqinensis]|uniref:Nucleotide modification associated domain-containing protein n=1 Tax=Salipaludibacillus keqinensis TaxID=2045207 RepID=A0A323TAY1_9BACI|nr:hypothetical protein [Salipaludibacillus keqinensis]PYZ92642.1 hypothetical protein CR194_13320 [Salipaludibacillus keqinensis]
MRKLIFSRKGFDSSSGFGYSPYDPATGKYILLPIPEGKKAHNPHTYEELKLHPGYLEGIQAENLQELIEDPMLGSSKKTREIIKNSYAHYDPILRKPAWLRNGPDFGAFGQTGGAAGHLHNNDVNEGSVFLFFSRFKPVKDRVHPLDPNGGWNDGVYYLYGWLKVGKIITNDNREELPKEMREQHPHGAEDNFIRNNNNTLYLASDHLFHDRDIPGSGYFPRLNDRLLLSSPLHKNKPSVWQLPAFFHDSHYQPTYLEEKEKEKKKWLKSSENPGMYYVQSPGRGQEYIAPLENKSENWLKSLFEGWRE